VAEETRNVILIDEILPKLKQLEVKSTKKLNTIWYLCGHDINSTNTRTHETTSKVGNLLNFIDKLVGHFAIYGWQNKTSTSTRFSTIFGGLILFFRPFEINWNFKTRILLRECNYLVYLLVTCCVTKIYFSFTLQLIVAHCNGELMWDNEFNYFSRNGFKVFPVIACWSNRA
jgi:hypothetical protein